MSEFNKFAKNYHEIVDNSVKITGANSNYLKEYKIKEIYKKEKAININKVLDFGCGDGQSEIYFEKYFPDSCIFGIDVSEKSIEVAKSKKLKNSSFFSYNGEKIPFEDNTFDLLFTAGTFHHINPKNHKKLLTEIFRVLKKDGKLYLFELNPLNPITRKIVRNTEFDKDAILIKASKIKELLSYTNFSKPKIKFTLFFPRHKFFKLFHFFEKFISWLPLGCHYYIKAKK